MCNIGGDHNKRVKWNWSKHLDTYIFSCTKQLTIKEEEIRIVYVWCVYFAYVDIIMYEINNNLKHTNTHTIL